MTPFERRAAIYLAIEEERNRQNELCASGKFDMTLDNPAMLEDQAVTILLEELGEVARAVNDMNRENLREELVQVAALCTAWLEKL